ncbi:unnamed protein product [Prorocentrum cordatum]|uniref:RING-type domain-containing protein n=1 Tax=Prorocentrum cordatum TaxID=2364126 RepID=A0ABN9UB87_9DINO|nr:unnamed protein product [Polarella glacialis]
MVRGACSENLGRWLVADLPLGARAGILECHRIVNEGDPLMDCRECNWYLCFSCSFQRQHARTGRLCCPRGHELRRWACQQGGFCDCCGAKRAPGEMVLDCRACDWYVCEEVAAGSCWKAALSLDAGSGVEQQNGSDQPPKGPGCPGGHEARPQKAQHGQCDVCRGEVLSGELVMACDSCGWYQCNACLVQSLKGR